MCERGIEGEGVLVGGGTERRRGREIEGGGRAEQGH